MNGIAYEDLVFDSECWDIESEQADEIYMDKVYLIATFEEETWKNLNISETAQKIFKMRYRTNWAKADSVYDAWLLCQDLRRDFFNFNKFIALYPDYEKERGELQELSDHLFVGAENEEAEIQQPMKKLRPSFSDDNINMTEISDYLVISNLISDMISQIC